MTNEKKTSFGRTCLKAALLAKRAYHKYLGGNIGPLINIEKKILQLERTEEYQKVQDRLHKIKERGPDPDSLSIFEIVQLEREYMEQMIRDSEEMLDSLEKSPISTGQHRMKDLLDSKAVPEPKREIPEAIRDYHGKLQAITTRYLDARLMLLTKKDSSSRSPMHNLLEEIINDQEYPKTLLALPRNIVFKIDMSFLGKEIIAKQSEKDSIEYEHEILSLLGIHEFLGIKVPVSFGSYEINKRYYLLTECESGTSLSPKHDFNAVFSSYIDFIKRADRSQKVQHGKVLYWDYTDKFLLRTLHERFPSLSYEHKLSDTILAILQNLHKQERCFIHGDLHKYQFRMPENPVNKITILDWESACWGIPHIDLVTMIEGYPDTTDKETADYAGYFLDLRQYKHLGSEYNTRILCEASFYTNLRYLFACTKSRTHHHLPDFYKTNIIKSLRKLMGMSSSKEQKQGLRNLIEIIDGLSI